MKLNVFPCRDGFLLSAECMDLPKRARDAFWPISQMLGVIECDDLPADVCAWVSEDIEALNFSFVATATALRAWLPTLAAQHPFDDSAQLHPGRR